MRDDEIMLGGQRIDGNIQYCPKCGERLQFVSRMGAICGRCNVCFSIIEIWYEKMGLFQMVLVYGEPLPPIPQAFYDAFKDEHEEQSA